MENNDLANSFTRLYSIMQTLRSPDGCPWDREQTPASLKKYLLEETYELIEAIEHDDINNIQEEIGDLLFLIIFLVVIYEEKNLFDFTELLTKTGDKMIRRHPHVFKNNSQITTDEVAEKWRKIKKQEDKEKGRQYSILGHIPSAMPALQRAYRIGERASRVGFDWPDAMSAFKKLSEEKQELVEAIHSGNQDEIGHETGDLLFAVANISRLLKINPEEALRKTVNRFEERFHTMEHLARDKGEGIENMTLEEQESLWNEAKKIEKKSKI